MSDLTVRTVLWSILLVVGVVLFWYYGRKTNG